VDGLTEGHTLLFSGKDHSTGKAITEVVRVLRTQTVDNVTELLITPSLLHSYERESLTIYANVARATHGETVQEVMGSGNASRPYQRFTLRQPPLTHISASTPNGAVSTLQVRVNDLLWHEVPTLYGHGPHEHIYVTRLNDEGKTTVQFGDGINGARLPTGRENVRATYRKGIGVEGLARAEQISLLMTRPLGVKGVVNPQLATGADDPESIDDVRTNAPLTVLTLDRAVSLRDYEDFARAFGGVAKALATWTWEGQTRRVFVTIAGPNGATIKVDSDTYRFLLRALREAGDPFVSFRVASYRPASFHIRANVKVESEYETKRVLAAVEKALHAQFSFRACSFGQPVVLSEAIAVMQNVSGVIAVDVDKLYRDGMDEILNQRLTADIPATGADKAVDAAELLTLHPNGVLLGVML
jgi:predicted phage baseplate assembly protein